MFFEGTEKKIKLVLSDHAMSLRQLGDDFWTQLVSCAGASILSKISQTHCDAYVLSESSLFVWDDRFLILTCGESTLLDCLLYFIRHCELHDIEQVDYCRRNEFMPSLQRQHFNDDLIELRRHLPGQAFRIGHLDGHHQYRFSASLRKKSALHKHRGVELAMYHIQGPFARLLAAGELTGEAIRAYLAIDTWLPEWCWDDHCFVPVGYSLNAIKDDRYFTVHITPQLQYSYVSIDTNFTPQQGYNAFFNHFLSLFSPTKWDVTSLNQPMDMMLDQDAKCVLQSDLILSSAEQLFFYYYQNNNTETLLPLAL